jgi:hypothetical protein
MSRLTAVVRSAQKLFGIHLLVTTTSVAATLVEEEYRTLSLRMEVTLMLHVGECLMSLLKGPVVLYAIQMNATVQRSLLEAQHRCQLVSHLPNLHMYLLPSLRESRQQHLRMNLQIVQLQSQHHCQAVLLQPALQMFRRTSQHQSKLTAVVRSAQKLFGIHLLVTTTSVAATLVEEEYRTLSLQMEVTLMLHVGECLMNFWTVLAVLCVIQKYATVHMSLRKARHQNHLRCQLRHRLHHQLHILQRNSPFVAALNVLLMSGTRWHVETTWVAVTLVEGESST